MEGIICNLGLYNWQLYNHIAAKKEGKPRRRWHSTLHQVVQVAPGTELRYAAKFGSKAFVPTRRVVWHNAGKRYEEDYAAASGYVCLLDTDLGDPYLWHYAAGIDGYRRVIGLVRQRDLDIFAAKVAEGKPAERIFIPKVGQRVLVTNGLFAGQTGKCIWANKKFSKIFIETPCNSVGQYLTMLTEYCAPAPKQEAVKESSAVRKPKTRRGRRSHSTKAEHFR